MNMMVDIKEHHEQVSVADLRSDLRALEQRAISAGLTEIALLIGCAKMALDDAMARPQGEAVH